MRETNLALKSSKQGIDNRSYARFSTQLRIVRLWFHLNNYKQCKASFETIDK